MKKIMLLIVFTVLVLACAINYKTVFQYIAVFFGIIFPFVLGGIIAFIINIPMRSLEKNLFGRIPWKKKEKRKGLMRGLSMVTAMALIVAVVVLVFFVVVPQLGSGSVARADSSSPISRMALGIACSTPSVMPGGMNLPISSAKTLEGEWMPRKPLIQPRMLLTQPESLS